MPAYPILKKTKAGFTLMEVLVSMVIVSFLSGAIYVTFAQGIKVWHAAVRKTENARYELFFEKLKTDLRNAFINTGSALNGQNQMIEFFTMVPRQMATGSDRSSMVVPARVRYRFNQNQKVIEREVDMYEKILNSGSKLMLKQPVLEKMESIHFEYYRHAEKDSVASWLNRWNDPCFPEAVKVTMDLSPSMKLVRIISMPALAGCVDKG